MSFLVGFILSLLERFFNFIVTFAHKHRFKKFGKGSVIKYGCIIKNPKNIEIGENVTIENYVWLNAGSENCKLIIKNNCHIGRFTHINAFNYVLIEEDVLIAENVYLGDSDHGSKVNVPVICQQINIKGPVIIRKGCFICKNAIISANTDVGEYSIIGPNSYVLQDKINNNSLLIGNPAKCFPRK